jgi:hypothetical protein
MPEHDFGIDEIFCATEGDQTDFSGHGGEGDVGGGSAGGEGEGLGA